MAAHGYEHVSETQTHGVRACGLVGVAAAHEPSHTMTQRTFSHTAHTCARSLARAQSNVCRTHSVRFGRTYVCVHARRAHVHMRVYTRLGIYIYTTRYIYMPIHQVGEQHLNRHHEAIALRGRPREVVKGHGVAEPHGKALAGYTVHGRALLAS